MFKTNEGKPPDTSDNDTEKCHLKMSLNGSDAVTSL